jgi:Outer membrane protein beta-barrel domain
MKSSKNKLDLMKRIGAFALTVLLLTASVSTIQAQSSLQLGVKGGVDYMKIGGRSFDGKRYPGFSGGIYGQLNFTSKWSLQPELNYNQTIGKTSDEFNTIYQGVSEQSVNLNYVSVPVLLVFKPQPWFSLLVGPQYGYLFSQTTNLLQGASQQNQKAFTKSDLSIVFGGQLYLNKITFGLRYAAGLNNICFSTTDAWRQYGLQIYVAYQLKDLKLK